MNDLVFKQIAKSSVVKHERYLVEIANKGLQFGSFDDDGSFSNEGYGYADADNWTSEEVVAVYLVNKS